MTITIDAPAEVEAAIARKAERAGLTLPEYFLRAAVEWPVEALSGNATADAIQETAEGAKEQARQEAQERIKQRRAAGVFSGASVDGFLATRAADARLEDERSPYPSGPQSPMR